MKTQRSSHSRVQWSVLFALASLGQPPLAADAPQLMTGVELPLLEARVLSGELATLPRDAQGNASVLIIGFSKAAAEISRAWLKGCRSAAAARPPGLGVHCYDVRMIGLSMFVFVLTIGGLKFLAYRRLKQRRSRILCMVVAGVCCLGVPYGTLLGIFTFVVLTRPSVVRLFQVSPPPIPAPNVVASGG